MALVDGDGERGGEVAAAGDDAAAILPEESSLQGWRDAEGLALLNAQQGKGIGTFITKTLKVEE